MALTQAVLEGGWCQRRACTGHRRGPKTRLAGRAKSAERDEPCCERTWHPGAGQPEARMCPCLGGCAAGVPGTVTGDSGLAGARITGLSLLLASQSYTFLISSDYERAEWRETVREQQKKCKWPLHQESVCSRASGLDVISSRGFKPSVSWAVELFNQVRY